MSTVALFVALGGGAYAAGGLIGENGAINGCVSKRTRALKVIQPRARCPKGTTALSFNVEGKEGPQGPKGADGTNAIAGPPTGPAGGDLSGSYPDPTIAAGAVTTADFASGATAPNAGSLGGIAPTGFIQGAGHRASESETVHNGQAHLFSLGEADGFNVVGDCNDINTAGMQVSLTNISGADTPVWAEVAGSPATEKVLTTGGGEFDSTPALSSASSAEHVTFHALTSSGPVTVDVWAVASSQTCTFSGEALVGF